MSISNNFSQVKVDAASTLTAVVCYHPLRTIATRLMAGLSFTLNPKQLYAGFIPSAIGSHQLCVISSVFQMLSAQCGNVPAAMAAGVASAPSTTFFDGQTARKQANVACAKKFIATSFRGIVPTAFRQMGLAMGMFVFPSFFERKFTDYTGNKEAVPKSAFAMPGGIFAALLTQYPETVRVVMQTNLNVGIVEAGKIAFSRMMSPSGAIASGVRVLVLGVAFTAMRFGQTQYPKYFQKETT